MSKPKQSNTMWGGRFSAGPDAIMEAINASIGFDQRLARQDIEGSRAHAAMLAACDIISDSDAEVIREGLLTVLSEIEGGTFQSASHGAVTQRSGCFGFSDVGAGSM